MYNKIFTKILDSSIWLEPMATRIVWLTLIAAMDEDGFAQFASIANLAHRARVTLEECETAVNALEGPDENSSDKSNDGRRIERVPGGWMVLNSEKYKQLVTRETVKQQTRARVANHRQKKKAVCNASVTQANDFVTPSDTDTDTYSDKDKSLKKSKESPLSEEIDSTWKPSTESKENLLKKVRVPKSYPPQDQFNQYVADHDLFGLDYRPDLYLDLCKNKWHDWDEEAHRWILIKDWRHYISSLEGHILNSKSH